MTVRQKFMVEYTFFNRQRIPCTIAKQQHSQMHFVDIQTFWEVPYIAHFCTLFKDAFKLPEFDIEDLEEALLAGGTTGELLLSELIISLLKGCDQVRNQSITSDNYPKFLRRVLRRKCNEDNVANEFDGDRDFHSLPLRLKISNLHLLCDIRLDSADIGQIYSNFEPGSLRVSPLGYDSKGATYWYFHGTRLYREDKVKSSNGSSHGNSVWQVICFTEDDWHKFIGTLNNRLKNERALCEIIQTDLLPKIRLLFMKSKMSQRQKMIRLRNVAAARQLESDQRRRKTT